MTTRVIVSFLTFGSSPAGTAAAAAPSGYDAVKPLLAEYCSDCHSDGMTKGGVSLDGWKNDAEALGDRKTWFRVIDALERGEMPPHRKAQPSPEQRRQMIAALEADALKLDPAHPDPGRVTLRRLNRAEYNNTIRQLLGVDFRPADDFPVDDSGYGFDNIGDALSLPPLLIEKYLAAADRVVDASLGLGRLAEAQTTRYPIDLLELGYNAKQRGDGWVALNSIEEDDVASGVELPVPGDYVMRVRAYAEQKGDRPITLTFMVDGRPVKTVEVGTDPAEVKVYEARASVPEGKHRLRAVVRRDKDGLAEAEARRWKSGKEQKGAVILQWLELDGPHASAVASAKPALDVPDERKGPDVAKTFIRDFARRAYRRPPTDAETTGLVKLAEGAWARGSGYREGIAVAMKAALVSPHFLFRGELQPEPDNPKAVHPVDEYALASRLSYFLWSSMPDEPLLHEAEGGTLRKNLQSQVRRMLADSKSQALVDNFGGQWLQYRNLGQIQPDHDVYPKFDEPLREAMAKETQLFFTNVLREDRSVIDFLTGDYTFVNDRLARHYKIDGVEGPEFRRVSLAGTPRRGVLTQAGVLAVTSNPTRTSPVKRGKWVLETFLNAPPPPPPPNVPELKEAHELTGTLRQRVEQHRENPACAGCHARMDPIGFGLENFDGIGAWREREGKAKDAPPVDASGELTTGEKFAGPLELIDILATSKKEQFVRCLTEKMLTYALGRGVEYDDRVAVRQIMDSAGKDNYRFSAFVLAITESAPFQLRRGDGS